VFFELVAAGEATRRNTLAALRVLAWGSAEGPAPDGGHEGQPGHGETERAGFWNT
jgi:hypothetical protein